MICENHPTVHGLLIHTLDKRQGLPSALLAILFTTFQTQNHNLTILQQYLRVSKLFSESVLFILLSLWTLLQVVEVEVGPHCQYVKTEEDYHCIAINFARFSRSFCLVSFLIDISDLVHRSKLDFQLHCILKFCQGNKYHASEHPGVHSCHVSRLKQHGKKLKHTKILLNFHLSLTMGPLFCSVLLMFTSIRNMVTNRAMRPGTISTGMRKPMKLAIVKRKVGRQMFTQNRAGLLSMMMVNPLVEKFSFVSLSKNVVAFNSSKVKSNCSCLALVPSTMVVLNSCKIFTHYFMLIYVSQAISLVSQVLVWGDDKSASLGVKWIEGKVHLTLDLSI